MKKNNVILLKDKKGKEKEFKVIASFDSSNDQTYIIYTANEKDSDGFIKTYAGILEDDNLLPIKSDEEWAFIEKILNKLDEE